MNKLHLFTIVLQLAALSAGDSISILPSDEKQYSFVGETYYVACATKGRNIQRVMWSGPDSKQIPSNRGRIHVEDGASGHKGVDLFFTGISKKDSGKYTCSANVDGKEVQASFELMVFRPIDFTDTPHEQFLEEGKDSTLKCNLVGEPVPWVSWRAHGKSIKSEKGKKYLQHKTNRNWIVVKNATLQDKGLYTCDARQVSQSTSNVEEFNITVKVHHKPMPISKISKEFYGYITGYANLTCAALAEPSADFTWLDDKKRVIRPSENAKIFNENRRSYLQLKIKDKSAFGDYYCKAQNRLGTLERVVTLQEGTKPPNPQIKAKIPIPGGFRLEIASVDTDKQMPVTGYKVEYKKSGDEWDRAKIREFLSDSEESYMLDGLQGEEQYVMRVSSKNKAGYSDLSKEFMSKTLKVVPKKMTTGAANHAISLPLFLAVLAMYLCTLKESLIS